MNAVRTRPKSAVTWQTLLKGLYVSGFMEEALVQLSIAEEKAGRKPIFMYYRAAILIAMGKTKEGLLHLETALQQAPKIVKKLVELDPAVLQHVSVVDLIAQYRRKR